jgi:hypothetical protein
MKMKLHFNKLWFTCLILILALGVLAFAAGEQDEKFTIGHPKVRKVMELQHAATPVLMSMEDVLGTAVGQDDDGEATLLIYVNLEGKNPAKNARQIPSDIAGTRVSVQFTEPFVAMGSRPGGGVSHTAKQTPPIQLGTSGGWRLDLANGYCCGGTLGSLIQVNGIQYILSNYHVFESDIVNGGNGRVVTTGDYVIQPGLIDVGCNAAGAQNVGRLVTIQSLPSSNVDASIAQVIPGMVSNGAILEIGTISNQTIGAFIGQAVKKSGRTTGLSRSRVAGLNATVSVMYDNECAGGTAFTKIFTEQIIISNQSRRFLNSGDSGSLMVEDVANRPRAIGLLFAGSSSTAVANPIGEVLTFIGSKLGGTATMVGGN